MRCGGHNSPISFGGDMDCCLLQLGVKTRVSGSVAVHMLVPVQRILLDLVVCIWSLLLFILFISGTFYCFPGD